MVVTPGLPLNWSWMHKPSVFLAVCQCERGGGSCRSGPGLNDGAHNLCFTLQWLCELWLVPLMLPCNGTRQETVCVVAPPVTTKLPERQNQSRRDRLGQSLRKLNERCEWMRRERKNEGMDRRDVVRELKRREGVWPVSALCWWMRIWGIVCRPICSSVGEVVKSLSQGWGPEGQEREVRAASRTVGTAGKWKHEKSAWEQRQELFWFHGGQL